MKRPKKDYKLLLNKELALKANIKKRKKFKDKQGEKKNGFSEAVSFTSNKKTQFFNLGPKNNWKNLLDEDLKLKLNNLFKKDLKDLSYN